MNEMTRGRFRNPSLLPGLTHRLNSLDIIFSLFRLLFPQLPARTTFVLITGNEGKQLGHERGTK